MLDSRYKNLGIKKLEFMLKESQEAFQTLTSAFYKCKWSKSEKEAIDKVLGILDFRIDRIKAAITKKGFEKIKKNDEVLQRQINAIQVLNDLFKKEILPLTTEQIEAITIATDSLLTDIDKRRTL